MARRGQEPDAPAPGASPAEPRAAGTGGTTRSRSVKATRRRPEPAQATDALKPSGNGESVEWLLLVYRVPSEPTRLRAGVWRKLKGLGAIYLQSSTVAIPASRSTERALRLLRAEIIEIGGTGLLFRAQVFAGSDQLRESFNTARDDEYEEIIDRCQDFLFQVRKEYDAHHFTYAELEENEVDLTKLKGWLERIGTRDVLGASKRQATVDAVDHCEQILEEYAARVYAEEGEASA